MYQINWFTKFREANLKRKNERINPLHRWLLFKGHEDLKNKHRRYQSNQRAARRWISTAYQLTMHWTYMRFLKTIKQYTIANHNNCIKDKINKMPIFNSIYYRYLINKEVYKISVQSSPATMMMNVGRSCHFMMLLTSSNGLLENKGRIIGIWMFGVKRTMIIRSLWIWSKAIH